MRLRWRAALRALLGRTVARSEEGGPELVVVLTDGERQVYPAGSVDRLEVEGCWFAPDGLRLLARADGQPFHACRLGTSLQLHFVCLSRADVERIAQQLSGGTFLHTPPRGGDLPS